MPRLAPVIKTVLFAMFISHFGVSADRHTQLAQNNL